jgi:hypothetical protein
LAPETKAGTNQKRSMDVLTERQGKLGKSGAGWENLKSSQIGEES